MAAFSSVLEIMKPYVEARMITRREFGRGLLMAGFSFSALSLIDMIASRGLGFGDGLLGGGKAFAAAGVERGVAVARHNPQFTFTQLRYSGGNWDPHHNDAARQMMLEVMTRTSVEAQKERETIDILDEELYSYPFLYMTGRDEFEPFDDPEVEVLRNYLSFGGFLFGEDCAGYKGFGFDRSFRDLMERIFPDRTLMRLPDDHPIYRSFYIIRYVGGKRIVNPYLEGIEVDGWAPIIYSQNDLGCAWQMDPMGRWAHKCEPGGEAQRFQAFKLGVNIILYSLTANYKKDRIHQPFIRKRVG